MRGWTYALPGLATSRELRAFALRRAASGGHGGHGERPAGRRGTWGLGRSVQLSRSPRPRDEGGGVASERDRYGATVITADFSEMCSGVSALIHLKPVSPVRRPAPSGYLPRSSGWRTSCGPPSADVRRSVDESWFFAGPPRAGPAPHGDRASRHARRSASPAGPGRPPGVARRARRGRPAATRVGHRRARGVRRLRGPGPRLRLARVRAVPQRGPRTLLVQGPRVLPRLLRPPDGRARRLARRARRPPRRDPPMGAHRPVEASLAPRPQPGPRARRPPHRDRTHRALVSPGDGLRRGPGRRGHGHPALRLLAGSAVAR